ncbi:hypothetical protein BS47DRAFT_1390812 [Hydnum rufescens UP504]|uniref:Carboxylic ester hydrolase n=1 Tax=Hydnum rufescens UP504 TaxID=1448309 RepID=A0A9P6B2T6_9AGAM|nr:hypothetical protein BS47DRAFT_1390812 [Hydnum rufescens UP504]
MSPLFLRCVVVWLSLSSAVVNGRPRGISAAQPPQVQLESGLVFGVNVPQFGQDYFLGIPYAQPPVGPLRFSAPLPILKNRSRTIDATKFGKVCLQPLSSSYHYTAPDMAEDCLSINVYRPEGISSDAKLPVMMWFYGGSFQTGGAVPLMQPLWSPTSEPVVYVSFNWRSDTVGFLASREMAEAAKQGKAILNAGLHDMILALQWVQHNINEFGGDKRKVTVFGQSSGAMSLGSILLADGGKAVEKLGLFRAAILQSGAPSGSPVPEPPVVQPFYDQLATAAGCAGALKNGTSLECLRAVPFALLLNASNSVTTASPIALPFPRTIDGYFHDQSPAAAVRKGAIAKVPLLAGSDLDDGTLFAPTTFNTTSQVVYFFETSLYISRPSAQILADFNQLLQLYPDDPALGSPYDPVGYPKSYRFYGPNNQYKRLASIMGDVASNLATTCTGRRLLIGTYLAEDKECPVYSYLFTQNTPTIPPAYGVMHGTEVAYVYGAYNVLPLSEPLYRVGQIMMTAWIAFANNLNPNRQGAPYIWPKYGAERNMLNIGNGRRSLGRTTIYFNAGMLDYQSAGCGPKFRFLPILLPWFLVFEVPGAGLARLRSLRRTIDFVDAGAILRMSVGAEIGRPPIELSRVLLLYSLFGS